MDLTFLRQLRVPSYQQNRLTSNAASVAQRDNPNMPGKWDHNLQSETMMWKRWVVSCRGNSNNRFQLLPTTKDSPGVENKWSYLKIFGRYPLIWHIWYIFVISHWYAFKKLVKFRPRLLETNNYHKNTRNLQCVVASSYVHSHTQIERLASPTKEHMHMGISENPACP